MFQSHKRNSVLFYFGLVGMFILCFLAIYKNLFLDKNFRQFTIEDAEPVPTDFYLHSVNKNQYGG